MIDTHLLWSYYSFNVVRSVIKIWYFIRLGHTGVKPDTTSSLNINKAIPVSHE
jgi:hypothetical protein